MLSFQKTYPDFYKPRPCVVEEEFPDHFVGRALDLQILWSYMCGLHECTRDNQAILAQRKMGKTALLTRYFNIVYWEQDQVIPLYYCFPTDDKSFASDISREIVITWLAQCIAFLTKKPEVAKINTEADLRQHLPSCTEEVQAGINDVLRYYHYRLEHIDELGGPHPNMRAHYLMSAAIRIVKVLQGAFNRPIVVIVDEVQVMKSGLLIDERKEGVECVDVLIEIATHPQIFIVISGSQVSMIRYRVLTGRGLGNRINAYHLGPLEEEESAALVQKVLAKEGQTGYPGIEKDIYKLVGGNPFYIIALLTSTTTYSKVKKKSKTFGSPKELEEVFALEVTHPKGQIYQFWNTHFEDNADKLNNEAPGQAGFTYQLLRYFDESADVTLEDIAKKYGVTMEEVEAKLRQLVDADLLDRGPVNWWDIQGITDPILRMILPIIEHKQRARKKGEEAIPQETIQLLQKHLDTIKQVKEDVQKLSGEIQSVQGEVKEVREGVGKVTGRVQTIGGQVNRLQGAKAERTVRKGLLETMGKKLSEENDWLEGYRLRGQVYRKFVGQPGQEADIDIAGELEAVESQEDHESKTTGNKEKRKNGGQKTKNGQATKPRKVGLAVEVKDWQAKIGSEEARKFIAVVKRFQQEEGYDEVMAIFVTRNGFTKPALEILRQNTVQLRSIAELGV